MRLIVPAGPRAPTACANGLRVAQCITTEIARELHQDEVWLLWHPEGGGAIELYRLGVEGSDAPQAPHRGACRALPRMRAVGGLLGTLGHPVRYRR